MSEDTNVGTVNTTNAAVSGDTASAPNANVTATPASTEKTAPVTQSGTTPAEVTPPAYTPNYKFKYLDKEGKGQIEEEFEDLFKPLIKDAETEEKIRKMHSSHKGLEYIKSERERFKQKATETEAKINEIETHLGNLGGFIKANDFDNVFKSLAVPPEAVLQWAVKYAEAMQSPETRDAYIRKQQENEQLLAIQQENMQLKQMYGQQIRSAKEMELDNALSRPDIAQVAQSFDTRMGRQGAFKDEIIKRGLFYAQTQQIDMPVDQVLGEVLALMGGIQTPQNAPVVPAAPRQTPPVIPNITGKSTSPAKKVPRSVEDLRKTYADMVS